MGCPLAVIGDLAGEGVAGAEQGAAESFEIGAF